MRVDLATSAVTLTEVCGQPGGLIANPPLVDEDRRIVVGFDSGNGVLAAFDLMVDGSLSPRWSHAPRTTRPTCSCSPTAGSS